MGDEPYEHEFGELFIEQILKDNFSHIKREAELFDIVAYRTKEDGENAGYTAFHVRRYPEKYPPLPFYGSEYLCGFELKTAYDDPWRFLTQLPRYCWAFDRVYLVLAEGLRIPPRLPTWVGVFKQKGDTFRLVRNDRDIYSFLGHRAVYFGKIYLPHYEGAHSAEWTQFMGFLRRIFINGLFKEIWDGNKYVGPRIVPYTSFDKNIIDMLEFMSIRGLEEFEKVVKFMKKMRGNQTSMKMFMESKE